MCFRFRIESIQYFIFNVNQRSVVLKLTGTEKLFNILVKGGDVPTDTLSKRTGLANVRSAVSRLRRQDKLRIPPAFKKGNRNFYRPVAAH
jgi:hypothetical protein